MPTLEWVGKHKVVNHHHDIPYRVLEHTYGFSNGQVSDTPTDTGNMIIHGDNLEALKSLLPKYEGKIKCIYIDPPYNTGNEGWVYNDNVNDPKIKKRLHQVVGKEGEDLSRHDKRLCMMYPRLKLLHKLLRDDGVIFVSIDDNEQANLKLMMDEIFGLNHFINNVIWQKKYSPQNDARYLSDMHDFVICYAKNRYLWNRNLSKRSNIQNERYKNLDNDPRGPWKSSDLSVKTYSASYDYEITTPSGKIIHPPQGRCRRTSKENFQNLVKENRVRFGKNGDNVPSLKRFLHEVQDGTVPVTLRFREEVGDNQEARQTLKNIFHDSEFPFDTPKPPRLIEKIVQISSNPGDIILDSFAGSGTTAHAVLNLNKQDGGDRKFILVELMDYAETITAERVKRVITGYGEGSKSVEGTGGGFDYFELGEQLFLSDESINPHIGIAKLREYIWYTETRSSTALTTKSDNPYFLGSHNSTDYYFYYTPDRTTTLNFDFLATLVRTSSDQWIIYADICSLDEPFMREHSIIFKKIPRDISRF